MPRRKTEKTLIKEECERLMYQLAFLLYGKKCEVCGNNWRLVVHHFIPREKCKNLTYEPLNLVVLCANCHFDLHIRQNSLVAGKIVEKRGREWLDKLTMLYEERRKIKGYYGLSWLKSQKEFLLEQIKKASPKMAGSENPP